MNWKTMEEAAKKARKLAYAPYSRFKVGAALLDDHGRIWSGCNVENASYGLSLCAERVAIAKMVSAGSRQWQALALAAKNGVVPCGACLQVLAEFAAPDALVAVPDSSGTATIFRLSDLLPEAFRLDASNAFRR
jgi:cytidine deaminase